MHSSSVSKHILILFTHFQVFRLLFTAMSSLFSKTVPLALFVLGLQCFVSCSKDWAELSGDNSKESGWVSFSINLPTPLSTNPDGGPTTRAAANSVANGNTGDTYVGNVSDRVIKSMVVIIYNNGGDFVTSFSIGASDVVGNSFASNPLKVKARKLKEGNYDVLVVANPSQFITTCISNHQPLSVVTGAANVASLTELLPNNSITMCPREVAPLVNWRIYDTKAKAENDPVAVTLERAVAKIFVSPSANNTVPAPNAAGGRATVIEYSLRGVNKSMYYVRRPNLALKTNGTATTDAVLTSENKFTPENNRYSVDPNMSKLTDAALTSQFGVNDSPKSGGWADDKGIFATENTVNADNQQMNQLTHVLVKLKYIPKGLPANTTTWAYYKGVYMDYATLESKYKAARKDNTTDELMDMPSGWKTTVTELYNNSVKVNPTAPSFDRYGLKFFQGGYSYYLVPIRHFDDTQQPKLNAYGRYGVVRNHIYKITINSVSRLGSPEPPILTDEPADQTPTFISANVVVQNWSGVPLNKVTLE